MSSLAVNAITDANGGSTTTINGYTPTESNMAGRNRIINGDMRIDQRGSASTPVVSSTNSLAYSVDRFASRTSSSSSQITLQQDTSAPAGFVNSLKATVTTTGSPTYSALLQRIEGVNVSDLAWGTSDAVDVTLSFWVRSSITGQYSVMLYNSGATTSFAALYTINSADTWEYKTITIPGPTSGNFPTNTNYSFAVGFTLGASASYSGTSGTWKIGGTQKAGVTGSVNLNQTLNATFYITGVQLEAGSVATPFERRQYGTELALCQRYYEATQSYYYRTYTPSAGVQRMFTPYKVSKRASPTVTVYAAASDTAGAVRISGTDQTIGTITSSKESYTWETTANNQSGFMDIGWYLTASAEL